MRDATVSIDVEIGVICGPRFQAFVDPLEQEDVLSVIARHVVPSALSALHAAEPEVFTRIGELTSNAEDGTKIVQFVTVKLKEFACSDKRVIGLEWAAWTKLVEEEPGEALLYIECYVVGDDDIGPIKDVPKFLH